jgi:hypothetical protein
MVVRIKITRTIQVVLVPTPVRTIAKKKEKQRGRRRLAKSKLHAELERWLNL